jgi:hypothetical protein
MAVAIMRDEAKVWTTSLEHGVKPESIHAPSEMSRHHHVREAQHHHGHETDHDNVAFFESISESVKPAAEIVLVGHGKGKANEMLLLVQYLERKHPAIAEKVVGAIDSDLESLSDNQVLALVREWFDEYHEFI